MGQARWIGLTGGIATGKSTVARVIAEHGIPILDADLFAREALAPGTLATQAVQRRYGEAVCTSPSDQPPVLDRQALAGIVFADPKERQWLEALVHPIVRGLFSEALDRLREEPVVVLMIPLLFEAGLQPLCTEIWVVECGSEAEQLRRLQARDGLTEAEALARVNAQWPMAAKLAQADVVIHTGGTPADVAAQVGSALATPPMPRGISAGVRSDGGPSVPDVLPIA